MNKLSKIAWDDTNKRFVAIQADGSKRVIVLPMAQYLATPGTLTDGDYHHLTLTVDKKLRTDDPTTQAKVDEVLAILESVTFGNEAIKDAVDAAVADLDNPSQYKADVSALALQSTLVTVAGYLDTEIQAIITALGVVQTDLDNPAQYKADVSALALESTLDAIKGTSWSDETLKAIKDVCDSIVTAMS